MDLAKDMENGRNMAEYPVQRFLVTFNKACNNNDNKLWNRGDCVIHLRQILTIL